MEADKGIAFIPNDAFLLPCPKSRKPWALMSICWRGILRQASAACCMTVHRVAGLAP